MGETSKRNTTKRTGTFIGALISPPTLPFDLIAEILCRLPVNLLLQLRCLSKSFNTLISDHEFAKKHLCMSTTRRHLVLSHSKYKDLTISYSLHSIFNYATSKPTRLHYQFDQQYHSIVGSCNGILCLAHEHRLAKQINVVLWKPSIRKFKILPTSKYSQEFGPTIYGFGYDLVNGVYKVLAIFSGCSSNNGFKTQGMIHTLGTNSWRKIRGELPLPDGIDESLKFVSGALNWIPSRDNTHNIVSFELVNESYTTLLQPNYGGEHVDDVKLGVSNDCLCIFAHNLKFSSVWLMKEYGKEESWTKLFCFYYMEDSFRGPNIKPLWISEDGQVLMGYASPQQRNRNLTIYDLKNGTLTGPMIQNIDGWITPEVCTESLISPCF
jgi:F-box interacting protein